MEAIAEVAATESTRREVNHARSSTRTISISGR